MFHLLWELPTITAGEPHGLHAVHGADVDALKQSFNWAASYPSTDTQYSAHTAAQVVLNRAATQRTTLFSE